MSQLIFEFFPQTDAVSVNTVRLGLVAQIFSGGTPDKSNLEFWEDGDLPWIGSGEVNQFLVTQPTTYITSEAVSKSSTKLMPEGSLIIALAGQGKTKGMVAQMKINAYGNQSLACISNYKGSSTFLLWWLTSLYREIRGLSSQDTRDGLNQSMIGQLPVPLYDLETQRAIAEFLDRETTRIDTLIAKKQRIIDLIRPKWEALIDSSVKSSEVPILRVGFVTQRMQRKITRDSESEFKPLGLLNRGRGIFFKNETDSDDLGDSEFFWVKTGDLILSGQFAWEGAVALANSEHDGCVVSHRYPVYRGIEGLNTAYLFAYLRTREGQFILDECSRGAAGRNKPLNTKLFEKWKIPIPGKDVQDQVAKLVYQEEKARRLVSASIQKLKEYRAALITAAVTGQIDVTTWGKQSHTPHPLERPEAQEVVV